MEHPEYQLNLIQIFLDRVRRFGDADALLVKDKARKQYVSISWKSWFHHVQQTAGGLYDLGIRAGDRVGILSENRPEWTYADLGALSLGAVTVPIYATSSCEDISYILSNAEVKVLFVSTSEQYERIRTALEKKENLKCVVLFDASGLVPSSVLGMEELRERGRKRLAAYPGMLGELVDKVKPDDLATLIYTSGTTGSPKGVMLTHRNFIANYLGASEKIDITEKDISLSFLPLSHVFERLAGYYFMAFHGARIAYAENMQTVSEDLALVQPTVAASVPRLYEKMHGRILEKIETAPAHKRKIFAWALRTGRQFVRKEFAREKIPLGLRIRYLAAKALVFNQLKRRLGGRLRFFISGGAPLSKDLAEFFYTAGILILEGYGLTETSPVITVNSTRDFKFGTVGKPLSNVKVKIAGDGEILTQGPCVMKGYYKNPEATREALEGGWFHTGDIGEFDGDGFLKITDRKKDIIVTSGGKNISPQNIEGRILEDKLFLQAVVIGDKRNYLVALLVPDRTQVVARAKALHLDPLPWNELLKRPEIYDWIASRLEERMKGLSSYEQVKYFSLLENELSQEEGELTPTLKVKRKIVMQKYEKIIEALYREGELRRSKAQSGSPAL